MKARALNLITLALLPSLKSPAIQNHLQGQVSKSELLTLLLPLSFTSLFGTLVAAAFCLPSNYDWRVHVISTLTSPHKNPQGYWLPSIGIMAAMLLAWPFAGYVAQRLSGIAPGVARCAGLAFAFSFVLILLGVAMQLAEPVIGLRWSHEFLARAGAGSFIVGMLCCAGCALKDHLRRAGGQRSLPVALIWYWLLLVVLPIGCLASTGTLLLLAHQADQTWAEEFRQSFRHTILWQLAFWEWMGAAVAFAFLTGSVLLLTSAPAQAAGARDGK